MRIPSGVTDQYIYFVAVDATDFTTRETGLTTWTVYRSRNGGVAAAMTTPTINETDSTNMPGVYELLLDEDMTIDSGDDSQEIAFHITHAGMAPVTRTIELYRPKVTAGETIGTSGGAVTNVTTTATASSVTSVATGGITAESIAADAIGASELAADAVAEINATVDTALADFFTSSAQLVDDIWDEALTGASHNVVNSAGRRIRSLQDNGLYALAAVWVDEVSGTSTGTTSYEDATVTSRSNDFDNAQTVAAALGLNRIYPSNGNSITLTAGITNFQIGIPGGAWTLALGGQAITGCDINDAVVSGTCTGTDPHFHNCEIGTSTVPPCKMYACGLTSTLTIGSAGDFDLVDCYSLVPGSSAPTIDLGGAVGATNMSIRRWSGGLTLNNVATGDVVSVDVVSGGTITVNGTGGTVVVRGMCNVVDGSSGSVTITETSVVNMTKINTEADTAISDAALATASALATVDANVDAILVDTGTTLQSDITAIKAVTDVIPDSGAMTSIATAAALATVDANVDAVLLDTGTDGVVIAAGQTVATVTDVTNTVSADVVSISGSATAADNLEASALGIVSTSVNDASATTTSFVTALSEATSDHYKGRIIIFTSGAMAGQATDITAYNGTTKAVTVTALTEAPANSVTFVIV